MGPPNLRSKEATLKAFVALVPLAFGIGLVVWSSGALRQVKASTAWPRTQGSILSATVGEQQGFGNDSEYAGPRSNITYEYQVAGVTYTSNRVSFGQFASGSLDQAEQLVARYPAGTTVEVRYNPEDPRVAVLQAGGSRILYGMLGAGVFIACTAVIGLVRALAVARHKQITA